MVRQSAERLLAGALVWGSLSRLAPAFLPNLPSLRAPEAGDIRAAGASAAVAELRHVARPSRLPRRAAPPPRISRIKVGDLEVGREMNGIVNMIAPFGVFVDVGAERDGLVPKHFVQRGFIQDLNAIVKPGQSVKVWVMEVVGDKFGLSMVPPATPDNAPNLACIAGIPEDQWLSGTVTTVTDYGIFVEVKPEGCITSLEGLVHVSQIKEGFVDHPADEAKAGQQVRVRVVEPALAAKEGKLKLSMRQPPTTKIPKTGEDVELLQAIPPTQWHTGRVSQIVPFGAFVEITAPGTERMFLGLLHISEVKDEGFVDDMNAEMEVGQEVRVRLVQVDKRSGRLSLSMKPIPSR